MQMNLNIYETIYRNKFSIIIFTWTILLVFSMLVPAANFVMKKGPGGGGVVIEKTHFERWALNNSDELPFYM
jgi:hypothetical protein